MVGHINDTYQLTHWDFGEILENVRSISQL